MATHDIALKMEENLLIVFGPSSTGPQRSTETNL